MTQPWPHPAPQLRAVRYTERPLPTYTHVPGTTPHPFRHQDGHSFATALMPCAAVTPVESHAWRASPEYLFGTDLYNHGYWWEAHEAWEGLWQEVDKPGPQGRFLQGLIQIAACHLKFYLGQCRGVRRLLTSGSSHLSQALIAAGQPPVYMGLDIAAFVAAVRVYYGTHPCRRDRLNAHDAGRYPYVILAD